ncbi:MAG: hypothetical protein ACOX9E_14650 [Lentisphaeria bacterium]|jgi:hypothetical protein
MRAQKRLEAASTLPKDARLAPFAKFLLQTTKLYAESVPHTSLGLRLRRNPREAPTQNSTLKACHIADTKDGFHRKATENGQLSMGARLQKLLVGHSLVPANCGAKLP